MKLLINLFIIFTSASCFAGINGTGTMPRTGSTINDDATNIQIDAPATIIDSEAMQSGPLYINPSPIAETGVAAAIIGNSTIKTALPKLGVVHVVTVPAVTTPKIVYAIDVNDQKIKYASGTLIDGNWKIKKTEVSVISAQANLPLMNAVSDSYHTGKWVTVNNSCVNDYSVANPTQSSECTQDSQEQ